MKEINDILGFKVEYLGAENLYELSDFPSFPDETPQSNWVFEILEEDNFKSKKIKLPVKINITERIKTFKYEDVLCFTPRDLFEIIKMDENLFVNTNTFTKVNLEYKNKLCVFTIKYFTIDENGTYNIKNINDLLEVIKIHFNKKRFTKKFISNKKLKKSSCPNYLQFIPLLPLLWLEYDNNQLCFFNYFKIVEDNINLPF